MLLVATVALVWPLERTHLPAALLLGAMVAAILISVSGRRLAVPAAPYLLAQALIGCLVARSIGGADLGAMGAEWTVLLFGSAAVLVFSTALGGLLARYRILPGNTALWGSAPGAAMAMILMADGFGGDVRLVAFMQYLRVLLVAVAASAVARLSGISGTATPVVWFPAIAAAPFFATLAIAVLGAAIGAAVKIPAGPLLVPLFVGAALVQTHIVQIVLPPWLMAGAYALIGWSIGLRFTRDILVYAGRAFARIAASIVVLIGLCAGLGYLLHRITGEDELTSYLATSPGGADSVAIIAASAKVDLPFVMAMQTCRFLLVLLAGPSLTRLVARRLSKDASGPAVEKASHP